MKILLTGATGFIGQHVLERLIDQGFEVTCTKRATSNVAKLGEIAEKCRWIDEITVDLDPDVIINLAWGGVDAANRGDWTLQIHNLLLQQQLLELKPRRFIAIGSQAEYGEFEGCVTEEYPTNPNSAYGATKVASMELLRSFAKLNNIEWYWFRLFSTYGEGEGDNWLIPSTIRNMMKGGSMDFTPGEQRYAYLYIGEIAQVIVESATTNAPSGIYNISSQNAISIKDLLRKIQQRVNPDFKLNFGAIPYRQGQAMWMQGDTTKLRASIYTPKEEFDEKLNQTIEYYKN